MQLKRKTGFSLVEILVVVAIIGLLIAILLPALSIVRRSANRRNDAANLKGIFTGLAGYADDNRNSYPKYFTDNNSATDVAIGFTADPITGKSVPTSFAGDANYDNNVSAALWLMARGEYLQPKIFINPASADTINPIDRNLAISDYYDFLTADNLSYSMINMYDSVVSTKWTSSVGPETVMLGNNNNGLPSITATVANSYDIAATTPIDLQEMNSLDHDGAGQNFVYADGHAEFKRNPLAAFSDTDNVYTYNDAAATKTDATAIGTINNGATGATINLVNGSTVISENVKTDVFLLPLDSL